MICSNAGEINVTLQKGPNHIQYVLDDKAITAILTHKSLVFALWIVLAATDPSQLRYLCNNFGFSESGISIQGLNSSYVRIDICNNTDMPNPNVARASLMKAMNNLFEATFMQLLRSLGTCLLFVNIWMRLRLTASTLITVEYTQQPVLSVAGIHRATLGLSATEDRIPA